MNQFRTKEELVAVAPVAPVNTSTVTQGRDGIKTVKKLLNTINVMSYVNIEVMLKALPFTFFLMLLGILYIANSYQTEKSIRKIDALNKELKELRSEYIASKSELMIRSRQSNVAQQVVNIGLTESRTPPRKIVAPVTGTKEKN